MENKLILMMSGMKVSEDIQMKKSNDVSIFKGKITHTCVVAMKSSSNIICDQRYCLAVYIIVLMVHGTLLT